MEGTPLVHLYALVGEKQESYSSISTHDSAHHDLRFCRWCHARFCKANTISFL